MKEANDLAERILRDIGETFPAAFDGDVPSLGAATVVLADSLGGMLALTRKHCPNRATYEAAVRMTMARVLDSIKDIEGRAHDLRAQAAPAYREGGGR